MTRVPYDPELVEPHATVLATMGPSLTLDKVPFVRSRIAERADATDVAAIEASYGVEFSEIEIPGDATGPASNATAIAPRGAIAGSARGGIVHVHGGGMVMGHRMEDAAELARSAAALDAVVIAISYRFAPEHPFPAAADDVLRAWNWILTHADALGVDRTRVALQGSSAGGGIAAGLALRLRGGTSPAPCAVALLAPMLDAANATASSHAYTGTGAWDSVSNAVGWGALLGEMPVTDAPEWASPANAATLAGLPPIYLDVGTSEVFRDEVAAFAQRAWADGVSAELHVWGGAFHGFDRHAPAARVTARARATRREWLAQHMAVESST